ncbi:anthranilate phosphoribosyltransferase [Methylovirgula sp. HY1]|uniref:anthranilate phosphoribosyltransferase n=1 Tax=Methylovirgula sp. HY1 TaxID=2822761 RepID=UPI001C5ABFCD|nr:anthranilate phosphoribosyltransferase [Methylovirgula sp. HY1]QXX73950.1 Anthranilate phosphoribosyltransferase [Methylovirgula sp. HY1]
MDAFKPFIAKIATGASLSRTESEAAFDALLSGEVTAAQMGAFLIGLRLRGETIDEITGAVAAMRAKMLRVCAPPDAIDVVGTGGDGHGTYNVSTLATLIVAACGVPVAKHGNRAASSLSGSSDVLAALGVRLGATSEAAETCLKEAGICFMAAPTHHAAMRHFGPVRSELGIRTLFNLLGPLANPAGVKRQLLGVFSRAWLLPLAEVLRNLGAERVWLVHGSDGLDELTLTGPSFVTALENGGIRSFEVTPEDAGLPRASLADLKGGDAAHNAAALTAVLAGQKNPYRDIAVLNAAAALVVAEKAANLIDGAKLAATALDSGDAAVVLAKLVKISNASAERS